MTEKLRGLPIPKECVEFNRMVLKYCPCPVCDEVRKLL